METVKMPMKKFMSEHKHLVKTLIKAKKSALKKEAMKQKKEMKHVSRKTT